MKNKNDQILYLDKDQVIKICNDLSTVKIIEQAFKLHGTKNIILPDEAYLSWINIKNESARSLNMPSSLGGNHQIVGTKIINGNISNFKRGIERASGITLLFDPITAKIVCIMEGAYISSLRTASVSALGIDILKKKNWNKSLAIIGLGTIAKAQLELLNKHLKDIKQIYLYDLNSKAVKSFMEKFREIREKIVIAKDPAEAVRNSDVIITTTTTNTGYIPYVWLRKGALIIHISLDDLLPDAITQADKLIVDDWNLVKNDNKRIFGRMFHQGLLSGLDTNKHKPFIHAEIAEVILNKKPGRENDEEIIIFNPFGLSIEDIAIASHVYKKALAKNIGLKLNR